MLYLILSFLFLPFFKLFQRQVKKTPDHILVIQTAKIGDMVCTLPVFDAIKARYPKVVLTVLCNPINAPLLRNYPTVDHVWAESSSRWKGLSGRLFLWFALKERKIDFSILLSPNQAFMMLPFWAGIPARAMVIPNQRPSYVYQWAPYFNTHTLAHQAGSQLIETIHLLLNPFQVNVLAYPRHYPVSSIEKEACLALLPPKEGCWIGVGISSGNTLKAFNCSQLACLFKEIIEKKAIPVLMGGAAEIELSQQLIREFSDLAMINAVNICDLDRLPALVSCLDGFIGVDSGLTYIADAVHIPLVDYMGPADSADQRPQSASAHIVRSHQPCAPCSHAFEAPYTCRFGTRACINEISFTLILKKLFK